MTPTLELAVGILLAAVAVYFVLQPILRPAPLASGEGEASGADSGVDAEDDLSPRAVALRALKEIEFDRATAKLSDADYEALKRKYTAEALAALRAEEPGVEAVPRETRAAAPSRPASVTRLPAPVCPEHGPRPEPGATHCSTCGRPLAAAPGFCTRCGAVLAAEARFCTACGRRVAA